MNLEHSSKGLVWLRRQNTETKVRYHAAGSLSALSIEALGYTSSRGVIPEKIQKKCIFPYILFRAH